MISSTTLRWAAPLAVALALLAAFGPRPVAPPAAATSPGPRPTASSFGALPLAFEPNVGQLPAGVRYAARGALAGASVTAGGLSIALRGGASFGVRFVGGREVSEVTPLERLPGVINVYRGSDQSTWRAGIPTYARLSLAQVYPGVDVVVYGRAPSVEFDFVVAPGASAAPIALAFPGADHVERGADGDLVVTVREQRVLLRRPRVYQDVGGRRVEVAGDYVVEPGGEVALRLGEHDPRSALVIDPAIEYATFLGGSDTDFGYSVAEDSAGNVYVAGTTASMDFPISNGAQSSYAGGSTDFFVAKLSVSGYELYATFLGGELAETAPSIAVRPSTGEVTLVGTSGSTTYPQAGNIQSGKRGAGTTDAVITRLDSTGGLAFSTYLGGSSYDNGIAVALSSAGQAYALIMTSSSDMPASAGYQMTMPNSFSATFIAKLNATWTGLDYGTYLGGSGVETPKAIAVDSTGAAYVVGNTSSSDFPRLGALQATYGGSQDGFITKFAPAGNALVYSTFLGGSGSETIRAIAVDSSGNAYVAGDTRSTNFPTASPLQATSNQGGEAFVAKLSASGGTLLFSTYLGGTGSDIAQGLALDPAGNVLVCGSTDSPDFPTAAPVADGGAPGLYGFVTKLTSTGTAMPFSSTLGDTPFSNALSIASDLSAGSLVVAGVAGPNMPPSLDAWQPTFGGGLNDAFLLRVRFAPAVSALVPRAGPPAGGTVVQVSGLNFVPDSGVFFGATPAAAVTFVDPLTLRVVTPAHAAGVVNVVVNNPDGTSGMGASAFTFATPPSLAGVAPTFGPITGGTALTLTGSAFVSGATVTIGDAGLTVTSTTATSIAGTTVAHDGGVFDLTVTNPDGQASTLALAYTYVPPPRPTAVTPGSGPTAGGTSVTVTGTTFVAGATVTFGGVLATSVTVTGPTSLTAVTPAHAPGLVAIAVTTPDGQSGTLAAAFTFVPPPSLVAVAPTTGPARGGTALTLSGSDFQTAGTTAVLVGDAPATAVSATSATSVTASSPAHDAGVVSVVIINPDGQRSTLDGGFRFVAQPTVLSVTPAVAPVGGNVAVSIVGADFEPGAAVRFGGTPATAVVVVDSSHLTATAPVHAVGVVDVEVANPPGVAGEIGVLTAGFTYTAPPVITALTPVAGPAEGGTALVIDGDNFLPGAQVQLGGVNLVGAQVSSVTRITATSPTHAAGLVDLVVTNPDSQQVTKQGAFTFVAHTVSGIAPATGFAEGGTAITLTGSGFLPGLTVELGGAAATSVVRVSDTTVTAITPTHGPGVVDVVVTNAAGQKATLSQAFTYTPHTVTGITPASGPTTGGTRVTVTGTGFLPGASLEFNGVAATELSVVNEGSLTAVTPAHGGGTVDVVVLNAAGQRATLTQGFTYVPAPEVSVVEPGSGPSAGGTPITVKGKAFQAGATLVIGGVEATGVSVDSAESIRAVTPAHEGGRADVVVTNPDGQVGTLSLGFTFEAPASKPVSRYGFSCASAPEAGGLVPLIVAALGWSLTRSRRR